MAVCDKFIIKNKLGLKIPASPRQQQMYVRKDNKFLDTLLMSRLKLHVGHQTCLNVHCFKTGKEFPRQAGLKLVSQRLKCELRLKDNELSKLLPDVRDDVKLCVVSWLIVLFSEVTNVACMKQMPNYLLELDVVKLVNKATMIAK